MIPAWYTDCVYIANNSGSILLSKFAAIQLHAYIVHEHDHAHGLQASWPSFLVAKRGDVTEHLQACPRHQRHVPHVQGGDM